MQLCSIKNENDNIICEFNDKLNTSGRLIKIDANDIFLNKNLQECIPRSTLLLIGSVYGFYKDIEKQFRIKNVNLMENILLLENKDEKIILTFKELLDDPDLISKVNSSDIVKWVYPYALREGYGAYQKIIEKEINSSFDLRSNILRFSSKRNNSGKNRND